MTKETLRKRIRRFIEEKSEAAIAVERLSNGPWKTFLFGGLLREICLPSARRHIRDIDIVIDDDGFDAFKRTFEGLYHKNRFGGLQFKINNFQVDAWSLSSTWAFREGYVAPISARKLPFTVFLNIDGLVAEISHQKQLKTKIFAEPYLKASRSRVLDICLEHNPYSELSSIRAIRLFCRFRMNMSKSLVFYILSYLDKYSARDCAKLLNSHYPKQVLSEDQISLLAQSLRDFINISKNEFDLFHFSEQPYLKEDVFDIPPHNTASRRLHSTKQLNSNI